MLPLLELSWEPGPKRPHMCSYLQQWRRSRAFLTWLSQCSSFISPTQQHIYCPYLLDLQYKFTSAFNTLCAPFCYKQLPLIGFCFAILWMGLQAVGKKANILPLNYTSRPDWIILVICTCFKTLFSSHHPVNLLLNRIHQSKTILISKPAKNSNMVCWDYFWEQSRTHNYNKSKCCLNPVLHDFILKSLDVYIELPTWSLSSELILFPPPRSPTDHTWLLPKPTSASVLSPLLLLTGLQPTTNLQKEGDQSLISKTYKYAHKFNPILGYKKYWPGTNNQFQAVEPLFQNSKKKKVELLPLR